jgi:hypothetical protein
MGKWSISLKENTPNDDVLLVDFDHSDLISSCHGWVWGKTTVVVVALMTGETQFVLEGAVAGGAEQFTTVVHPIVWCLPYRYKNVPFLTSQ